MITGDYDFLTRVAGINLCAEHKSPVSVAWHGPEKCWTLRCGQGEYPDVLTRQLSLTQEYKAGADIPEPIKSNIIKGQRRRRMTQEKQPEAVTMGDMPAADFATGELIPKERLELLISYAYKYALDPYRSHVVLMYGKPYITIDGYLYYANKSGKDYSLNSRPMSTKEYPEYKVGETDHGWLAEVIFIATGARYTGVGIVTYEEMTSKSPRDNTKLRSPIVAAHPWQLAQKRAEWQALRRAFPIGEAKEENVDRQS